MKLQVIIFVAVLANACKALITELLERQGQTKLLQLIERARGLRETLEGEGPLTLFAPSQEFLESLPADIFLALADDPDLEQILLYHIIDDSAPSADLANELLLETIDGTEVRVNTYEVDGNEPITTINGVPVNLENVDNDAENGLIHYLDGILLSVPVGNVTDTLLVQTGETFDTLLHAIANTEMFDEDLAATNNVTVLAPADSRDFNIEFVDQLLADTDDVLDGILRNHVISGTLYSIGFGAERTEITSINGTTLFVDYSIEFGYVVEDSEGNMVADIIAGDIPTTQGVLHVIDRPIII